MDLLLHLDIMLGDFNWMIDEEGNYFISNSDDYTHFLSVFGKKSRFAFKESVRIMTEHRASMHIFVPHCDRLFLIVRDPVDATYSTYRRCQTFLPATDSFENFLNRFIVAEMFHTGIAAPPMELFALYLMFWMSRYEKRPFIIRYEDVKLNPRHELERILQELGIQRTTQQIDAAIAAASFVPGKVTAHKYGVVSEWKTRMSEEEYLRLTKSPTLSWMCKEFGYPYDSSITNRIETETSKLQAALQLIFLFSEKIASETPAAERMDCLYTAIISLTTIQFNNTLPYLMFNNKTGVTMVVDEDIFEIRQSILYAYIFIKMFPPYDDADLQRRMVYFAKIFYASRNNSALKVALDVMQLKYGLQHHANRSEFIV
ncbi:MAG: sulfotransferase domain-containing protein [Magnetococcales bacterium]|nr:sulfotransferase domain-containing protein [Magnetococcales bacterium]